MSAELTQYEPNQNSVVVYQSEDGTISLDVQLSDETVWLTQQQMADLFQSSRTNIVEHIKHIYQVGELTETATCRNFRQVRKEGNRLVTRQMPCYNLDLIISVGYRVNSMRGVRFRQWANRVLKSYLLNGYAISQQLMYAEQRIDNKLYAHEKRLEAVEQKVDFFVRTSLPPHEGVLFDGQIFDAYEIASKIIRSANHRIILFDNYIDETVLNLLDKRQTGVTATIYTKRIDSHLQNDIIRHDAQYPHIEVQEFTKSHDRFLCIDDIVYHIGASLKDLGQKWFAFNQMEITTDTLLSKI